MPPCLVFAIQPSAGIGFKVSQCITRLNRQIDYHMNMSSTNVCSNQPPPAKATNILNGLQYQFRVSNRKHKRS